MHNVHSCSVTHYTGGHVENTTPKALSAETLKSYNRDFKNHVKWTRENKVKLTKSGAHVVEYLKALETGYPNNKPKSGKTLRRYFNAIRHGYLTANKDVNFDAAKVFIKEANQKKVVAQTT